MPTLLHPTLHRLGPGDAAALRGLYLDLSDASRALRFAVPMPRIGERTLQQLCNVDDERHVAIGATVAGRLVAVAHRIRSLSDLMLWDVAFVVADEHQGQGIGSMLFERLAADALESGIHLLGFHLSGDNRAMIRLLSRKGVRVRYRGGSGEAFWSPRTRRSWSQAEVHAARSSCASSIRTRAVSFHRTGS
jgi:GNAT superfamily N-acetyltransferase